MRMISPSTSLSIRGRPRSRRARDPSNLRAMNLRCHARMVSGWATVATSLRALAGAQTQDHLGRIHSDPPRVARRGGHFRGRGPYARIGDLLRAVFYIFGEL